MLHPFHPLCFDMLLQSVDTSLGYKCKSVVGAKPRVSRPLEVAGKGIRGVGEAAIKEAYTVQNINIISEPQ
jgi:hypothetical protein